MIPEGDPNGQQNRLRLASRAPVLSCGQHRFGHHSAAVLLPLPDPAVTIRRWIPEELGDVSLRPAVVIDSKEL